MPTKEELEAVIDAALAEAFAGLWDRLAAAEKAERYAHQLIDQHACIAAAATEAERKIHRQNILHLTATIKTEATDRYVEMGGALIAAFSGALKAVISLLINAVLVC